MVISDIVMFDGDDALISCGAYPVRQRRITSRLLSEGL